MAGKKVASENNGESTPVTRKRLTQDEWSRFIKTWKGVAKKGGTTQDVADELGYDKTKVASMATTLRGREVDLPTLTRASGSGVDWEALKAM